jgi:hypothetical protein
MAEPKGPGKHICSNLSVSSPFTRSISLHLLPPINATLALRKFLFPPGKLPRGCKEEFPIPFQPLGGSPCKTGKHRKRKQGEKVTGAPKLRHPEDLKKLQQPLPLP